ncbi:MAG: Ig-like domain-containing protein, partial [Lachnospiraceae bacterium]|nr:Ig-like domain-containing protein [Lachnospiraceae bacterium]
ESESESETERESALEAGNETGAETGVENGDAKWETEMKESTGMELGTEGEGLTEPERPPEDPAKEDIITEPVEVEELITEAILETEQETREKSVDKIEIPPEKIYRGYQYEIRGDINAWYRDEKDRMWVRAGSALYIEPKPESGYGRGVSKKNLQEDGMLTFCLQKLDEQGNMAAESALQQEAYYVDNEAPAAGVTVTGVMKEGTVYAAQSAEAAISVEPDGKSGLKAAAYAIVQCAEDGSMLDGPENVVWHACTSETQVSIQEEGTYQIYVRTEDRVGNVAFSKSSLICVDQTSPEITIEGVADQTANSGEVIIKVSCSDRHYKAGSLSIDIAGRNTGKRPSVNKKNENGGGAFTEYFDFPRQKSYDDVYQLSVQAEDISGNRTEQSIDFSVNRFGSVYDLTSETRKKLQQYYLNKAQEIIFCETNIDYVGESDIFCRRDGELQELVRGKDYQVSMLGSMTSWKQYRYTIPAGYFKKEGVYELLLSSRDRADNQSDTGMQEKRVAFVLDWTAPSCVVTGIEARKVYEEEVTACIVPQDNVGLKTVKLYHDSVLIQEGSQKNGDPLKIQLKAGEEWQTLQIYLQDFSGNEYWSEEIPVFVGKTAEAAPVYRKKRMSAKEKEEQKYAEEKEESSEKQQLSGGKQTGQTSGQLHAAEEDKKRTAAENTDGMLLLIFGIFMLLVTAAAGIMTGFYRKN